MTAYIALGSNLGDRAATLLSAVRQLNASPGVQVRRLSSFHDTVPVGGPSDQPHFLNAAAELATDLSPDELLHVLLAVESTHGRIRDTKDGPRTLDLDLLLYGDLVRECPDPVVPHPRMASRAFVLEPLAEIAAEAVHPTSGATVRELLNRLCDKGEVPPPSTYQYPHPNPSTDRPLLGQRALVTGSTGGIGRAVALALARAGADIIVHGRRPGDAVVAEIETHAARGRAIRADLRDPDATKTFADAAWSVWDGLDIAVLNAGVDILTGDAAKWPFERKLNELLAVDVASTIVLGRSLGKRMRERGRGVILTVGWDQAETGMEGDSGQLFAAAKGAVMAFSRSLALSLAPTVRVNCLALGWIRTDWGASASEVWQERVRRETPLGRWGTPEDVAAAAEWLSSPAAAYITGQTIRINGGAVR